MNITMLSTQKGSEDGFTIKTYEKGVDYSLGRTVGQIDLAKAFVAAGMASEQVEEDVDAPAEPDAPAEDGGDMVEEGQPAAPKKKKAAAATPEE